MSPNRCPVCGCVIADNAQRCDACCTDLGDWDTEPSPLQAWLPVDSSGALWLDDLGKTQATPVAAVSAPGQVRDAGTSPPATSVRPPAFEPPLPEIDLQPHVPLARHATEAVGATFISEAELRSARKAARRAQVRRARLHDIVTSGGLASADSEVLVVDPDPVSRAQLCAVLGDFGFGVMAVADPSSAPALATPRTFISIFVSIATTTVDGGDGIDLCQQLRGEGHRAGAVVLVVAQLRPVDRVRAELAGCDETISQPVTRGIVARVMDDRGIVLPLDARRT